MMTLQDYLLSFDDTEQVAKQRRKAYAAAADWLYDRMRQLDFNDEDHNVSYGDWKIFEATLHEILDWLGSKVDENSR